MQLTYSINRITSFGFRTLFKLPGFFAWPTYCDSGKYYYFLRVAANYEKYFTYFLNSWLQWWVYQFFKYALLSEGCVVHSELVTYAFEQIVLENGYLLDMQLIVQSCFKVLNVQTYLKAFSLLASVFSKGKCEETDSLGIYSFTPIQYDCLQNRPASKVR